MRAIQSPIAPRIVENAPCHEIVIEGAALDQPGNGLDGIPLPISTPGWDVAPYATLSQYITKDPDTGVQNMGNYRGHVKSPRRLGRTGRSRGRLFGYGGRQLYTPVIGSR